MQTPFNHFRFLWSTLSAIAAAAITFAVFATANDANHAQAIALNAWRVQQVENTVAQTLPSIDARLSQISLQIARLEAKQGTPAP